MVSFRVTWKVGSSVLLLGLFMMGTSLVTSCRACGFSRPSPDVFQWHGIWAQIRQDDAQKIWDSVSYLDLVTALAGQGAFGVLGEDRVQTRAVTR